MACVAAVDLNRRGQPSIVGSYVVPFVLGWAIVPKPFGVVDVPIHSAYDFSART